MSEGHGDEPAPLRAPPAAIAPPRAPVTCADIERLVDAFADAELPTSTMVAVARHAAGCASCEESVRRLQNLHDAGAHAVRTEGDALDLSGPWPGGTAGARRG